MNNQIFVFGSNLAGRHGKGSALEALQNHGAIYGEGEGPQGNSYGIPTKDHRLNVLSSERLQRHIEQFCLYAQKNPDLTFNIVDIGCGLARWRPVDIAPFFLQAPENCNFSPRFKKIINDLKTEQEYKRKVNILDEVILSFNESEKELILEALESLLIPDSDRMTGICFGVRSYITSKGTNIRLLFHVDDLIWSFFPLWPNYSGHVGYPIMDPNEPGCADDQFEFHYNRRSLWQGKQGEARTNLVKFMIQELKLRMRSYEQ